jgi:hypothetical protein
MVSVGDGLAFGGQGFISDMIKLWTDSEVSHWATVLEVNEPDRRIKLIESTTLNGKDGVQINYASERIASYEGRVWWLPLSIESKRRLNAKSFTEFMLAQVGKPYDKILIAHLFFDKFQLIPARENWHSFICSELGAAGAKASGLLPLNIDSAEITPQSMCEFMLWESNYYQIKGSSREIRKYNTKQIVLE